LRQQFEELHYREAWLLDPDRLEEWLDLLSEKIHYWAPVRADMNSRQRGLQSAAEVGILR
jgi:dibenzofuran dioxygenase beta subunit